MESIIEIIKTMSQPKTTNVNPTVIYNEGWITRLLVHYSVKEKLNFKGINFNNLKWTSEGLLSSPFISVKKNREGYTHADIVFGDFEVDFEKRGKIKVKDDAEIFGVIEAKMGSSLSKKTSNALNYNQASRNVTCIASNTDSNCKTYFYIVAPKSKTKTLKKYVDVNIINEEIEGRFFLHNMHNEKISNEVEVIRKAGNCHIEVFDYEEWIEQFIDKDYYTFLEEFYTNCKLFNKIK